MKEEKLMEPNVADRRLMAAAGQEWIERGSGITRAGRVVIRGVSDM